MDPGYLIILITLFISAFSSGVEIAFVSSSRLRIELDKNKGSITGKILGFFYRHEGHFLAALLLGNNIALVLFGIQAAEILNPIIASWGGNRTSTSIVDTNSYFNHSCIDYR